MAYHQYVLLQTTGTETGAVLPIEVFTKLLVTTEATDTCSVRVDAQQADGAWHTLGTLKGTTELNVDNYGWYALRAACVSNDDQATVCVRLSGRRA